MARKFSAFTNSPTRAATDTLVGLDVSAAAAAQNSYWTLNTLFSQISDNTTDGSIRWGGVAAPAVSAAGKGAIYFDSTANAFRVSQNAGAYAGFILGTIANTQVAVGSAAGTVTGSSAFTFASGVAAISGTATPGVVITGTAATESGVTVNQSVSGAAADAFLSFQTPSSAMQFRLTTAGFTPTGLIKANQLDMLGATGTVEMLFRLADASTRFVYGVNNGEAASINATSTLNLVLGADSGAAVPLTGRVRMYNSAGTTYSQISAGNAGSSLNFIWPVVNPTVGQVLSASAPSGSDVTLSWVAASSVTSLTATQVGFGDGTNMLSGSADFTYTTATGVLDITKTGVNSSVRMAVTNASAGTAAQARFGASADNAGASLAAYSSTFTTAGLITADTSLLDLDSPTAVIAARAAGTLIFGMGTTTERARLTDTTFLLSVDPTTGSGLNVASATVTTGNLARIAMTGTAAGSNTKTALNVTSSGANGTASQTVFGQQISVTNTGTTNTNIALQLTASGGATANTALNVTAGDIRAAQALASYTFSGGGVPSATGMGYGGGNLALSYNGTTIVGMDSSGGVNFFKLISAAQFGFTAANYNDVLDTILRKAAAANFAFGAADAAAPVAQTLSVQSVVAGTSNTAGVDWTFKASAGTGTGAGGAFLWQTAAAGSTGTTQNTFSTKLTLTGDGRLFGSVLHNNTGAVTGTTNQYIASGTYTPTVTAVANCASAGDLGDCQWIRVGNVVTVSGEIVVDPDVAATLTQVGISLPIASNFVGNNQCVGTAATPASTLAGAILSDLTNDRAELFFTPPVDVASRAWAFIFTYVIL